MKKLIATPLLICVTVVTAPVMAIAVVADIMAKALLALGDAIIEFTEGARE